MRAGFSPGLRRFCCPLRRGLWKYPSSGADAFRDASIAAAYALAFTVSIDVAGVGYWKAFAPFVLATLCIWMIAFRYRQSVPRHGLRNMGIAVATWFALYTLMLDPALQLFRLSSPWWWVLAGIIAVTPIVVCLFASSRR